MAKEDASVAIQNALQKLDQQPILLHNDEKLKSVKSDLHRFSSRLDRFDSIKLTEVREVAYDAEDAMDDAIVFAAKGAHQRWRKLRNLLLFFSHKINHQRSVEEQLKSIGNRTASIDRSTCYDSDSNAPGSEGTDDEDVVENNTPQEDLFKLFKLFYHSLSGFPAEVEIPARQLIQIWAADGILDPQRSTSMEEQGRDQINWLLNEGYITEAQKGTCGNLKTLKIKKERLDVCIADAKDADFLHVKIHTGKISESEVKIHNGEMAESELHKAARLAIHNKSTSPLTGKDLRSFADLSKVRYLQIHCNNSNSTPLDCGSLKPFASLRVLDLGSLKMETVPKGIGKLVHLRYLRLRAPKATRIPTSICKLPYLQTIDLKETDRVKMMPVEIWKMKKNLRHVHLGGATALPPPQMANHYYALEKLQTLCGVRPDKELKRLMVRAKFPNVNRLRLQCTNKRDSEEFLSFLNSLDLLSDLRSLTLIGPIGNLPESNAFPSSMIKMTLWKTRIPAGKCVETLEKLPNLRYLKLMEDSVAGKEMKCTGGGFPGLELLRMKGLKELELLRAEKGAMRLLRDLEVRDCARLERVEAFQPSKDLKETLQKLQGEHEGMTVRVE